MIAKKAGKQNLNHVDMAFNKQKTDNTLDKAGTIASAQECLQTAATMQSTSQSHSKPFLFNQQLAPGQTSF